MTKQNHLKRIYLCWDHPLCAMQQYVHQLNQQHECSHEPAKGTDKKHDVVAK